MELGDRFLVVQRAALGATGGRRVDALGNPVDAIAPAPITAASILAASNADADAQPTRVLQILNMVAVEELTNDEDYKEILEDIKEECGKFGTVEEVRIPRPVKTDKGKVDIKASEAVKDLGKVFVLFDKPEETTTALRAIAGRQFGGEFCFSLLLRSRRELDSATDTPSLRSFRSTLHLCLRLRGNLPR